LNWFRKLLSSNTGANKETDLVFKSGEGAFEYACKFMDCTLGEGKSVPAIVIDARKYSSDIGMAVKTELDKSQLATIRVASKNGGFVIPVKTAGAQSSIRPNLVSRIGRNQGHPDLKPGDLVSFTAMTYSKDMAKAFGNKESGWVGLITSKLEPRLDVRSEPSIWQIEEKFHD